jgi:hypothetical protein
MAHIIVKGEERRAAEARTLREFGISPLRATAEQREYAERITADNSVMAKEFNRMEEMSR